MEQIERITKTPDALSSCLSRLGQPAMACGKPGDPLIPDLRQSRLIREQQLFQKVKKMTETSSVTQQTYLSS
jgi:hypothetical protein